MEREATSLFRLTYYSTNTLRKTSNPSKNELRKIIASAKVNNRANGITGGLMFNRNYFGQVLEGNRTSVSDLFCKIARDPRHSSIVIMEATAVDSRLFDRWAMGLAEQSAVAEKLNEKYGHEQGYDPTRMNAADFLSYILEMVCFEQNLISVAIPTWDAEPAC
jgi:hypothetical protein